MGFFNKKQDSNTEEKRTPRNPNNVVTFRVLAIGYIGYMCINIIKLYNEGGPDAPSLTALLLSVILLGGGALFLALLTYKEWKRNKADYDAYMAELRAEAEAKRAAEEVQAAALAAEDEYYEALEAAEAEDTEE